MIREIRPILAIAAVVTIVVLAAFALRPGTAETVVHPRVDLPPPGQTVAVVMSTQTLQDTSLFGLIKGETHIVSVQLYAPPECMAEITQGDHWPVPTDRCSSDSKIDGVVSGTGVAPAGETIVLVDVESTEECLAVVSPSDPWPASSSHCS